MRLGPRLKQLRLALPEHNKTGQASAHPGRLLIRTAARWIVAEAKKPATSA